MLVDGFVLEAACGKISCVTFMGMWGSFALQEIFELSNPNTSVKRLMVVTNSMLLMGRNRSKKWNSEVASKLYFNP